MFGHYDLQSGVYYVNGHPADYEGLHIRQAAEECQLLECPGPECRGFCVRNQVPLLGVS